MILSGNDVRDHLRRGSLGIHPLDDDQIRQNGVDLVLRDAMIQDHGTRFSSRFWLGCTAERIELPDNLMAFVQLRSTWARSGFIIPPTIVDAGFRGDLTIEILQCGMVEPPIGKRFVHLIFARTTGPCEMYGGKYQHQTGITGPIDG